MRPVRVSVPRPERGAATVLVVAAAGLLLFVGLFLLDLYAKRVRLFGYRTIKFD